MDLFFQIIEHYSGMFWWDEWNRIVYEGFYELTVGIEINYGFQVPQAPYRRVLPNSR
jgi:hypothetical protein